MKRSRILGIASAPSCLKKFPFVLPSSAPSVRTGGTFPKGEGFGWCKRRRASRTY